MPWTDAGQGKSREQIIKDWLEKFDADAQESKLPKERIDRLRVSLEDELTKAPALVILNLRPGESTPINDLERLDAELRAAEGLREAQRSEGFHLNYPETAYQKGPHPL